MPSKFEEIFSKFAKTEKTRMTFWELMERTAANRNAVDPFGWYVPNDQTTFVALDRLILFWLVTDSDTL